MRNFDARMEEILRRGEELKKVQNRRKKRLLTVIPVALCCVLCLGVFPLLKGGSSGQTGGTNGGSTTPEHSDRFDSLSVGIPITEPEENAPESSYGMAQPVDAIHITGKGMNRLTEDPAVIAEVCALLTRVTAATPNFSIASSHLSGSGDDPTSDGDATIGKTQTQEGYILSLVDAQGNTCQYRLNQSVLTRIDTGETDFLREDDLTELYGLLGIPAA